jgi:hypothetical protein
MFKSIIIAIYKSSTGGAASFVLSHLSKCILVIVSVEDENAFLAFI